MLADPNVSAWYRGSTIKAISIPIERQGRYVRITRTSSSLLSLAEVQVWSRTVTLMPLGKAPEIE